MGDGFNGGFRSNGAGEIQLDAVAGGEDDQFGGGELLAESGGGGGGLGGCEREGFAQGQRRGAVIHAQEQEADRSWNHGLHRVHITTCWPEKPRSKERIRESKAMRHAGRGSGGSMERGAEWRRRPRRECPG